MRTHTYLLVASVAVLLLAGTAAASSQGYTSLGEALGADSTKDGDMSPSTRSPDRSTSCPPA